MTRKALVQYFKDFIQFARSFYQDFNFVLKKLTAYSISSTCLVWVRFAVEGSSTRTIYKK